MVTRQPHTFALTSPMPRPHKLRTFVSNYYIKVTRRRMVRESIEAPPPLPPKEPLITLHTEKDPSLGNVHAAILSLNHLLKGPHSGYAT